MDATPSTGDAGGPRVRKQVRKLIDGPGLNHLIEGRQGYVLFNANDRYIGKCLAEYGEWSPGETDLFQRLVRADIGRCDLAEKSRALVELLRSQGYRLRLHKPPLYPPTNYAGSGTDLFPGIVSRNVLCIHESRDGTPVRSGRRIP